MPLFNRASCLLFIGIACQANAQTDTARHWSFHFQQTVVTQGHPGFRAKYEGLNSLKNDEKGATSLTTTLFVARRLWKNAHVYFNPELAGGTGLSGAVGVAGFTNGETFRIGDPRPQFYIARAFFRQLFPLSPKTNAVNDDVNQVHGQAPESYLSFTFGKYSIADYFDANAYGHDPRLQFLNWSLMSNGAWDYPANTRGYTYNAQLEWVNPTWAIRAATSMVPEIANGPYMDLNIRKARSETVEVEKTYRLGRQTGKLRLLGFYTQADMGNYRLAVRQAAETPDITDTRAVGRTKYGWGVNWEHHLNDDAGLFARASWNDGRNETWAFTEIDRSASLGYVTNGRRWHQEKDQAGVAVVANGISPDHQAYLRAGGRGFMIGDGDLNYAPETIFELFYAFHLPQYRIWITPDYQFVVNPAYNRDRGPVHIGALRIHLAF